MSCPREDEIDVQTSNITGWQCSCGNYEESDLHCSACGFQPPWGCDCDACHELDEQCELDNLDGMTEDELWEGV